MDIKWQTNALRILRRIADTESSTVPCVAFIPQKKITEKRGSEYPLKRCAPEDVGVSSEYIEKFLDVMEWDRDINPHTIMIIKNSRVIFEGAFEGYSLNIPHVTHSACKSITALAIGIMVEEGLIGEDTKIVDILGDEMSSVAQMRLKDMELRHLLTMSSGVSFNDVGLATCEDWAEAFLDSRLKFTPGEAFMYNSMNSYMLSYIVKRVTDEGLSEFLDKRLFSHMGIRDYYWERCPKGIEKGGWGLYMLTEDLGKLGLLVLNKGKWGSRQLISREWIEKMTTAHMSAPSSTGDYDYGLHAWRHRGSQGFIFNGMFGQNVFGFPQSDTVVVLTAGNSELFQSTPCYRHINNFFSKKYWSDNTLLDKWGYENLRRRGEALKRKREYLITNPQPKNIHSDDVRAFLKGKRYEIQGGESASLMPLIIQVMSNNYTPGLKEISFDTLDEGLSISFKEGMRTHVLPVTQGEALYTSLNFSGDEYKVSVLGRFTFNENDDPVLIVKCNFCETSCSRIIKFVFFKDKADIFLNETPGHELFERGKGALEGVLPTGKMMRAILEKTDNETINKKTREVFEPHLVGILKK